MISVIAQHWQRCDINQIMNSQMTSFAFVWWVNWWVTEYPGGKWPITHSSQNKWMIFCRHSLQMRFHWYNLYVLILIACHRVHNYTVWNDTCLQIINHYSLYTMPKEDKCSLLGHFQYSISQEICTRLMLCCGLLWLYIDWFSYIPQAYFTGTVAILRLTQCQQSNPDEYG